MFSPRVMDSKVSRVFAPKITDKFLRNLSSAKCKITILDISVDSYEYVAAELQLEQKQAQAESIIKALDLKESVQITYPNKKQFLQLTESLKNNTSLQVLELTDAFKAQSKEDSAELMNAMFDAVKTHHSLRKIILDGCDLSSAQTIRLINSLRACGVTQVSFQRCQFQDVNKVKELVDLISKRENFQLDLAYSNLYSLLSCSPRRIGVAFQLFRKKWGEQLIIDEETGNFLDSLAQTRMTFPPKSKTPQPVVASHHFSFLKNLSLTSSELENKSINIFKTTGEKLLFGQKEPRPGFLSPRNQGSKMSARVLQRVRSEKRKTW